MTDSSGTEKEPTMKELLSSMNFMHGSMQCMHDKLDNFKTEMTHMQKRMDSFETEQTQLKERMDGIESNSIGREALTAQEDNFKEEMDKMRRASNLILFGVQESQEGMQLAESLLRLLLPHNPGPYVMTRHGEISDKKAPRPLRVHLNNSGERGIALSNKRLLKGKQQYKSISVNADRTKRQRELKPRNANSQPIGPRVTTRSISKRNFAEMNGEEVIAAEGTQPPKRRQESTSTQELAEQINAAVAAMTAAPATVTAAAVTATPAAVTVTQATVTATATATAAMDTSATA